MAKLSADRRKKALMPETPDKIQRILKSISLGAPNKIACEANGMSETHFYNLLRQGLCDIEVGNDTEQARMVKSLRAIEEADIHSCVADIKGKEKSNRGSEWYLERRYWKYFGQNVSVVELAAQMDELKAQLKKDKDNA